LPKGDPYSDTPTPFRYLRGTDFSNGYIEAGGMKYLRPDTQAAIARYTTLANDVVISVAGQTGISAAVPLHSETWNLTENAAYLRPGKELTAEYLDAAIKSAPIQSRIEDMSGKVGIQKLALFRLADIESPCRPLPSSVSSLTELTRFRSSRRNRWGLPANRRILPVSDGGIIVEQEN